MAPRCRPGLPQVRSHRLRGGKPRAQRNRVARRGRPLPARGERGRQHAKLLWVGPGPSEAASRAGRRLARGTHHLQDAGDALPVCLHDVAAAVHHALVPLGRNVEAPLNTLLQHRLTPKDTSRKHDAERGSQRSLPCGGRPPRRVWGPAGNRPGDRKGTEGTPRTRPETVRNRTPPHVTLPCEGPHLPSKSCFP